LRVTAASAFECVADRMCSSRAVQLMIRIRLELVILREPLRELAHDPRTTRPSKRSDLKRGLAAAARRSTKDDCELWN
jgi:cytochrome c-type biogenesis protein CcmH/NrfG